MEIEITDNSGKVGEALLSAVLLALETCGQTAEAYAKLLCPVGTGNLRNSIAHQLQPSEPAVYVGTNSEYAPYVELGTGKYYPGGRPTPWAYQDAKGNWHWTAGNPAKPFVKPAVADHAAQYRQIIEEALRG